jgi:hypothetical protein
MEGRTVFNTKCNVRAIYFDRHTIQYNTVLRNLLVPRLESQGSSACDSLNSLEIVDRSLEYGNPVLSGGTDPLKTFPDMRAFSDISPTSQINEFMYARLNLNSSFNVPSAYEPDVRPQHEEHSCPENRF